MKTLKLCKIIFLMIIINIINMYGITWVFHFYFTGDEWHIVITTIAFLCWVLFLAFMSMGIVIEKAYEE